MWLGMAVPMLGGDIDEDDITLPGILNGDGSYTITLPFYDDDGYDECLDDNLESYISVTINNNEYMLCWLGSTIQDESNEYWYRVRRIQSDQGGLPWDWELKADGNNYIDFGYKSITCKKNGSLARTSLTFYLPAQVIQQAPFFKVHLEIWANTVLAKDYKLDEDQSVNSIGTFPIPKFDGSSPSLKNGATYRQEVTVESEYNGTAEVTLSDNKNHSKAGRTATWDYGMEQSEEVTYTASYKLNPIATIQTTNTKKLYQYRKTTNFKTQKAKNGGVQLSWDIEKDKGKNEYPAGGFVIQKKIGEDNDYQDLTKLDGDAQTYYDPEVMHSPDIPIIYRIRREKAGNGWEYDATDTINRPLKHSIVSEFTSTRLMEERQVELEWLWNYNPKDNSTVVLEEGSQFVITREVSLDGDNFNLDEETRLDCSEFLTDTVYTEDKKHLICKKTVTIPQSCVLYRWKIRLQPAEGHDTHYKPQEDIYASANLHPKKTETGDVERDEAGNIVYENNPEGLNDSEIASLEYFNASHGYFGDRVELDWKIAEGSGSLDVFSVQRREYGEPDRTKNPYVQIATVEALNGIVNYSYTDTKAVPGKVYEYLIEGSKECANEEVKTEDYSYGFTTPAGNIYGRLTFDSENGQAVAGAEVRLETKADISGKSYKFDGSYYLEVNDSTFLQNERTDSITFQLFAKVTDPTAEQTLLEKPDMYKLYVKDGSLHFRVGKEDGGKDLKAEKSMDELTQASDYIQITAISAPDGLSLYVNNEKVGAAETAGIVQGTLKPFAMGRDLTGYIDEVRVWNRTLSADDIAKTFDSYLGGDEDGLVGYWNFNYSTTKEFYDFAHKDSHLCTTAVSATMKMEFLSKQNFPMTLRLSTS